MNPVQYYTNEVQALWVGVGLPSGKIQTSRQSIKWEPAWSPGKYLTKSFAFNPGSSGMRAAFQSADWNQ